MGGTLSYEVLSSEEFIAGFPQALEIMENLENYEKKFHAWKKSWNLKNKQP